MRRRRAPARGGGRARRREGLSGIEFGVNIPGTVGGAVRMNANAYGGELGARARVGRRRHRRRASSGVARASSASPTGSSNLREGEIVTARRPAARARRRRAGPGDARGAAPPPPRGPAAGDQDVRLDLQEPRGSPRARARSAGMLLAEAGCNGLAVGGARFAPKHANFIENTGRASTADVLAVMAEGRRRVLERFGVELEPEVQTLGDVRFPWQLSVGVRASKVEDDARWIAPSPAASRSAAPFARGGAVRAGAAGPRPRAGCVLVALAAPRALGALARRRCAALASPARAGRCSPAAGCGCATPRSCRSSRCRSAACTAPRRRRSKRRWAGRRT